jgi:hypothetical protein
MKVEADGTQITMGQLSTLANARGRFIKLLCASLAEMQELAEAGKHQELANLVITKNREVVSLLKTMEQGVSRPH